MSKIYVAEYTGLAACEQSDSVPIFALPPSVEYTITVSAGSSGAANPIQPDTKYVEISTDTTCSIAIGPTVGGSAALTNQRLQTNERIVRRVPYQRPSDANNRFGVLTTAYSVFTTANV
jgi:hypothetical protein